MNLPDIVADVFLMMLVLGVVLVIKVVLGREGFGGGGGGGCGSGGDCASMDVSVGYNHGNSIDKSLKHACVRRDALVFQLLVTVRSYYVGGDCDGPDGVIY